MIDSAAAAAKIGVNVKRIRVLLAERRIPGARLIGGRKWLVPANFSVKPGRSGPNLNIYTGSPKIRRTQPKSELRMGSAKVALRLIQDGSRLKCTVAHCVLTKDEAAELISALVGMRAKMKPRE